MQDFDLFRLDGHTLRIFVSVCETRSVSRTAELVGLNQSTISHTLDKMRAAVRDPLFTRSGRGITPTEKALAIVPRVQRILAELEGLVAAESYDAAFDLKPVAIAIPTPALLLEMKNLYQRLLAASPALQLKITRLAPRERIVDILVHDEADLAIAVAGYRYPAELNAMNLAKDELVIFYDPECRGPVRSAKQYAEARHGAVNFGGKVKSEVDRILQERGMTRRVSMTSPTASMMGDLIKGTDLISTMPKKLATTAYRDLAYCPVPFKVRPLAYELVWHRRYEHSGRNMWLRQNVIAAFEEKNDEAPAA